MRIRILLFILLLFPASASLLARDSKYTRHGSGPKYWIAYAWCYDNDKPIPEDRWQKNIDWMAENLRDHGYNMISNDGWIEAAQTINENGYITKYCSYWKNGFDYWNKYIKDKGMNVGVYYNPMWMTRAAFFANTVVAGTDGIKTTEIVGHHNFNDQLFWVDVRKEGAEQWIKGYVRYFINLGVSYLRIDFLENYERNYGTEAYDTALKWISEEAGEELFLSLVMPNCYKHGETEIKYGDMIRVSNDCFDGGWNFVSARNRGKRRSHWPQYDNVFDGFIAFSDITKPGQLIADGDFIRLSTLRDLEERRFEFSLMVMAGSSLTVADEYDTATKEILEVYTNSELLALNNEGFVGNPYSMDITSPLSSCWFGEAKNGDIILGLFNREEYKLPFKIDFVDMLGLDSPYVENIRDLWTHKNLGAHSKSFDVVLDPHSCKIVRIQPGKKSSSKSGFFSGCSR